MIVSTYDYGYIREPKEIAQLRSKYNAIAKRYTERGEAVVSFDIYIFRKLGLISREFAALNKDTLDEEKISRWCRLLPFKPSKDQLVRYLQYKQKTAPTSRIARMYEVPETLRDRKPTTSKKELERIVEHTDDEVLAKSLEYRSTHKLITNDLKNWVPGIDGRVHSTFRYIPPTGQLNSSKPNVQNASKHSELGQLFRGIVEAPKGYCFVELDYERFHICTMGRLANDPDYIRFGQQDSHTIFTSYVIGHPIDFKKLSDSDLKLAVRDIRKVPEWEAERNERCKHALLAINNGARARKIWWMNKRFIHSIKEAEKLCNTFTNMFPKVERFKDYICEKADKDTYLIDAWGQIRWFFDVFTWRYNKRFNSWERLGGTEHEEALSYKTQSEAFGMIKEKIKLLDAMRFNAEHNFINTIHDSLMFMPEIGKRDRCIEIGYKVLTENCKRLAGPASPDGLKVGVGVATGRVWSKFDAMKNPFGMQEIKV